MALPAPPFGSAKDNDLYGIKVWLRVFIRGGEVKKPSNVFESRIERLVEREKQVERLSGSEFIENAKRLLASIKVSNISLITINSRKVYQYLSGEQHTDSTSLDEIVKRALLALNRNGRPIMQVSIVAAGKNQDFQFKSELIFKRIHRLRDASILFRILAIPQELTKKPEESQLDWISRLNSLLDDKGEVTKLNEKNEILMGQVIANYERFFRAIFDVRKIVKELRVDLGRTSIPQ